MMLLPYVEDDLYSFLIGQVTQPILRALSGLQDAAINPEMARVIG